MIWLALYVVAGLVTLWYDKRLHGRRLHGDSRELFWIVALWPLPAIAYSWRRIGCWLLGHAPTNERLEGGVWVADCSSCRAKAFRVGR